MANPTTDFVELRFLERELLAFLARLLERMGYRSVQAEPRIPGNPDLIAMDSAKGMTLFELKLSASPALLRNAHEQVRRLVVRAGAAHGVLITLGTVNQKDRQRFGDIDVWDVGDLVTRIAQYPDLASQFSTLLRSSQVGKDIGKSWPLQSLEEVIEPPPVGAGEQLATKLKASVAGRSNKAASIFEDLCKEALELLYGKNFAGFKKQALIEKGYQRLDLIGRLVPQESFWITLSSDFRTRYVIFEFKNYSKAINQDEVHSTERYLFTSGLRSVAIIIARKGDSESAKRAMRGALREQGKLILCISLPELCDLLVGWDNGDSPNELLAERLDEMLMSIAR